MKGPQILYQIQGSWIIAVFFFLFWNILPEKDGLNSFEEQSLPQKDNQMG